MRLATRRLHKKRRMMKLERFEVRLRPKNPAEQELIEALDAQGGIYGGKNDLMRECLRRGYAAIKQKMESMPGTGGEVETIVALAQDFVRSEYGYRAVKTYLNVRNQAKAGSAGQSSGKVIAAPAAADPAQTVVAPPPQQPEQAEHLAAQAPDEGAVEVATKRKVDWSRMRWLASSGSGVRE